MCASFQIVSRGMLRTASSIASGSAVKISIQISPEMIPSFRVIAFYYTDVDIIADSVWVDVEGWCEGKVNSNQTQNQNQKLLLLFLISYNILVILCQNYTVQ